MISKQYIAGYVDGEGCLSASKRKDKSYRRGYTVFVITSISSTTPSVLLEIQSVYGGSICLKTRGENHKELSVLTLAPNACAKLLKDILPYLVLKKKQAHLILELKKTCKYQSYINDKILDRRDEIYEELKVLNKRGL